MKSKRPLFVNISMSQGYCNCNCVTCNVNKENFLGEKLFLAKETLVKILDRIDEALHAGISFSHIGLSGLGEPTLHPEFIQQLDIIGHYYSQWKKKNYPIFNISLVTNGLKLYDDRILEALCKNKIKLRISFPTYNYPHYIKIMQPNSFSKLIWEQHLTNIQKTMDYVATGKLLDLTFHISPPYKNLIKEDLEFTITNLLQMANKATMKSINLEFFPAATNRGGYLTHMFNGIDFYSDTFKKYNKKYINGVKLNMALSSKVTYPKFTYVLDLFRAFDFPCMYFGSIFLTAKGESICCNDQNATCVHGSVHEHSISKLMEIKEKHKPDKICKRCNVAPWRLTGHPLILLIRLATFLRRKAATFI